MINLSKCLLIATTAFYVVGCGGGISTPAKPSATVVTQAAKVMRIPYRSNVSLKVGESTIVHGARGKCGQQPIPWSVGSKKLPRLSTGVFSNGGLGIRESEKCGGDTPAVAIKFTATKPGTDKIKLFGDPISITVK